MSKPNDLTRSQMTVEHPSIEDRTDVSPVLSPRLLAVLNALVLTSLVCYLAFSRPTRYLMDEFVRLFEKFLT